MADLYSDIPELSAQQAAILRRKKIAEAIQAQSMQPLESQQIPNGYVVPTSPLLGLGKVLEAYLGKKAADNADTAQLELGQKAQGIDNQAVADYIKSRQPTETAYPVDNSMSTAAQEFAKTGTQITPKTPQELDQIDLQAQLSNSPKMRVAGAMQAKLTEAARNDQRDAASKADAARIAAENKLDAQRQQGEILAAITNSKNTSAEKIAADKLTAKDSANQAKLAAKLPQAKLAKDLVLNNNDNLKNALIELRDHPGLEGITGSIYGRVPSVADESTAAQAKLDTIKNQIFVSTLQAMRASSKTGGAVGNVSDKEGERLENSMAALSRVQPTEDFKAEINKIINRLDTTNGLMNNAFDEEYGGIQTDKSSPATPSAPAQPRVVDW